jgi:hypothetical protein
MTKNKNSLPSLQGSGESPRNGARFATAVRNFLLGAQEEEVASFELRQLGKARRRRVAEIEAFAAEAGHYQAPRGNGRELGDWLHGLIRLQMDCPTHAELGHIGALSEPLHAYVRLAASRHENVIISDASDSDFEARARAWVSYARHTRRAPQADGYTYKERALARWLKESCPRNLESPNNQQRAMYKEMLSIQASLDGGVDPGRLLDMQRLVVLERLVQRCGAMAVSPSTPAIGTV